MGPKSRFRKRLITYLEDAHRAEFFHGSRDAVIAKRKVEPLPADADSDEEIDWEADYRPPTQTLPKPPPRLCNLNACTELCANCRKNDSWWESYKLEVDDLLVRSNVHTHYLSVENQKADDAKRQWRKSTKGKKKLEFKIKRERKGCLTKTGVCRARFPREVFAASEMTDDGHINVRHIEPMMNTVNPILTFLNRCNTDVSSLLSGTAIKAVVSYVSDYISKLSLKSYQMFASVYDVFQKESEMSGGTEKDKDTARHMVRKMVNAMSAKMEIGSPMASMYLLGNPDHYASHKYRPFAWRQHVQFVRSLWVDSLKEEEEEEENDLTGRDEEERVPIGRMDNKFVPSSAVDDYRFRPAVFNNMTLYEWVQCSTKKKRSYRERELFEHDIRRAQDFLEDEPEEDGLHDESVSNARPDLNDDDSDWETDDEDDIILDKEIRKAKWNRPVYHPFSPDHPLFLSHSVTCNFDNLYTIIPNFIGGTIPRSDKGDRAAYCMTILTLFKPWRTPANLKDIISTWDQAFKDHKFTDRQSQLIKNFDVRYECNDARDDHFAQMRKK
ncbi:hypothetical protein B0H16DRAFT_1319422, partial [Mycena metata]